MFVSTAALIVALSVTVSPGQAGEDSGTTFVSDRISVATRGNGPDIVLVPGLAAHRDVWNDAAARLEHRYRLHLVQVNGFAGVAPGGNADGPVLAPVTHEIARYLRETGLERPAMIGHSMGGTLTMMLAARHPGLLGRLMVVDVPPFLGIAFGGTAADGARAAADRIRSNVLTEPAGSPASVLEQMIPAMTRSEAMRPVLLQYARDSHRRTVAAAFHELVVTDLRPELARIAAPMTVLFVVPTDPPVPPDEFERALRESFDSAPRTRLKRIEDSRHFIQIDQLERFVEEVEAFMERP